MARSSIHIEAGKSGYFAHNSRESYTENSIFSDEENFCSSPQIEAFELYKKELKIRTEAYLRNHPIRKKLHAKTIMHLSAIINFNKEHTSKDIQKVCTYMEQKFDTKVIQYAMHRDEGHIIEEEAQEQHNAIGINTKIKNYHAHIEFMGLDSRGNSIRRKLDKPTLKSLQTEVAEILGMERGRKSGYTKAQYVEIISRLHPQDQYKTKQNYRAAFAAIAKELGYKNDVVKAKRLGTYDYKATQIAVSEAICVIQKELGAEISRLRAELQAQSVKHKGYSELEEQYRDLIEHVKSKDLTIVQMESELEGYQENKEAQKNEIKELETQNKALQEGGKIKEELENTKNDLRVSRTSVVGLTSKVDTLKEELSEYRETQNKALQDAKQLQHELDNTKNALSASRISIVDLNSKVDALELQISKNSRILSEVEEYKRFAGPRVVSHEDAIYFLEKEGAIEINENGELPSLFAVVQELWTGYKALLSDNRSLESELRTYQGSDKRKEIEQAKAENRQLERKLAEANELIKSFEQPRIEIIDKDEMREELKELGQTLNQFELERKAELKEPSSSFDDSEEDSFYGPKW